MRPSRQLYFAIEFSRPVVRHQLLHREEGVEYRGFAAPGKSAADKVQVEGKLLEAGFEFDGADKAPLLVKVALSGVSEQGALANLAEMPGWDFDAERARAHAAWDQALAAVDIQATPNTAWGKAPGERPYTQTAY